jgi:hypothetical protein
VVHVYDLVDWVSEAGLTAGKSAAQLVRKGAGSDGPTIPVKAADNVRYVVPQTLHPSALEENDIRLQMRVTRPIEKPVWVEVRSGGKLITRRPEPYARPGEMVTIALKPAQVEEIKAASELRVAIVER